jgi:hypothetical protein
VTPLGIALYHIGAAAAFEDAYAVEGGRGDLFEAAPPMKIAEQELEVQIRCSSSQALQSARAIFNRPSSKRRTSRAESEINSKADEREAIVKILLSCPDIRHQIHDKRKVACVLL